MKKTTTKPTKPTKPTKSSKISNLKSPISNPKSSPTSPRRLEDIARGRAGCFPITPTLIRAEAGFNSREDLGDLAALAADIEANGLQQPLKIRKERGTEDIFIIDGHRRHSAITTILIPNNRWPRDKDDSSLPAPIECTCEKQGTRPIDRFFMQLSMNTGKPFTFLEESRLYLRILTADPTLCAADIARRTGKTKQAVSDSLRLVKEGCDYLLEKIKRGGITASTALIIIKQSGPDAAAQKALYLDAHQSATAAGRPDHIMPKDVPGNHKHTPDPTPEPTPAPPPAPTPAETLYDESDEPKFTLYLVDNTPTGPIDVDSPFYHETDRLVLTNPPAGIHLLHLLCAATPYGPAYGYRVNDRTRLPDVSHDDTLNTPADEGYPAILAIAMRAHGTHGHDLHAELEALLTDAIYAYYPSEGEPEEPERIEFVAESDAPTPPLTGIAAIKAAPSTNRDGSSASSGGGTGYAAPDKRLQDIEKILDDLADAGKGEEDRITTAEIVLAVLRNERPPADLKNHLLG